MSTIYGKRLIDFENHSPWTIYGKEQVEEDFGNARAVQGGEND